MMKRLTYRTKDGAAAIAPVQGRTFYDAIDRLAAYEDTGLEPEEVAEVYRRFSEARAIATDLGQKYADLADELLQAEAEGRLLVLPCKVGDTVYWIHGHNVLPVYIQWFETNEYGWCACGKYPPRATPTLKFDDFGKTVFLTREEAEAALVGEVAKCGSIRPAISAPAADYLPEGR